VSISTPSIRASRSTSGSEKDWASRASAANAVASPRYSRGRTRRSASWSTRAVTAGEMNAGRNCVAMNSAEVASGSRVSR
jgi:hypothetical protein